MIIHNIFRCRTLLQKVHNFRSLHTVISVASNSKRHILRVDQNIKFFKRSIVALDVSFKYEDKLRKKDKISSNYELIYRLPRAKYYTIFHCIAVLLNIALPVVFGFSYAAYYGYFEIKSDAALKAFSSIYYRMTDLELFSVSGVGICLAFMVLFILREIPLRIYYDGSSQYIATFRNDFLPWKTKLHKYDTGKLIVPRIMRQTDSRYLLGKRRARVFIEYFKTPQHLWRMASSGEVKKIF